MFNICFFFLHLICNFIVKNGRPLGRPLGGHWGGHWVATGRPLHTSSCSTSSCNPFILREISIEVNLLQQTLASEVQSIQRTTASSKSSVLLAAFSCTQNSTRGLRLHVVAADNRCDQELSHSQPHRRMVESVAAALVLNSSCRA